MLFRSYAENLLSITTNSGVISVNCLRPSDGIGILLQITDGNMSATYDFRSAPGNSWGYYNVMGATSYINKSMYLDFFFDAAAGLFSVRAAGDNTPSTPIYNSTGSATSTIPSFSSLSAVKLYGLSAPAYNIPNRVFDDFYLTAGNSLSDVFLGPDTRVYSLYPHITLYSTWQQDPRQTD